MTKHEKRSLQYRLARRFDLDPRRIMEIIREEIKKTPLTEEPPKGEWTLAYRDCGVEFYYCSKCKLGRAVIDGSFYKSLDEFKKCPNCGADMRSKHDKRRAI